MGDSYTTGNTESGPRKETNLIGEEWGQQTDLLRMTNVFGVVYSENLEGAEHRTLSVRTVVTERETI